MNVFCLYLSVCPIYLSIHARRHTPTQTRTHAHAHTQTQTQSHATACGFCMMCNTLV